MIATTERQPATEWQFHEAVDLFPRHDGETLAGLRDSIAERGVLIPIVVWRDPDGVPWVVDGRARVEIATELGRQIPSTEFVGTVDAMVREVVSVNKDRRHLTSSQRACLAVDTEALLNAYRNPNGRCGRPTGSGRKAKGRAMDEVAQTYKTNRLNIAKARKLKQKAPDVYRQVKAGDKSVHEGLREVEAVSGKKPGVVIDQLGLVLPESLHEIQDFSEEIEEVARKLTSAMRELKEMAGSSRPGSLVLRMALPAIENEIREAARNARDCKLYTRCPVCHGTGCGTCVRQGWVTKRKYDQLSADVRERHAPQR